jgi:acetyl/propionyl-CoA carboxylase alpha subunit
VVRKLLIANRGEIAVRIVRAAQELGIRTVAVASTADSSARHAAMADEVVEIGGPEPTASYLDQGKIVQAAIAAGADAVHPGYGFLSERPLFARACRSAGLVFVGPGPEAMERLGGKIGAKALAVEHGVPVAPGLFEPGASSEDLRRAAESIGFPVMLKASAGGGGRGMRVVHDPREFDEALRLASDEALKAFGDGSMMVEKYVDRPRHVEVQVLADHHGTAVCLFERECSIQRRHQKIIEEAPSPVMTDGLWASMRDAAVRLVTAAGYTNAGTVEFMVDAATGEFYFLEVNARLQVEHPVTEAVTGVDLVQWQIRIASGEQLRLRPGLMAGDRSALCGHAIEARIVAEDPAQGFLPSVGRILGWAEPKAPGVRFDTGVGLGDEVSPYYDSLLAKLTVHAESRAASVRRLERALLDTHVLGPSTNIGFLLDVVRHPEFSEAAFDTGWIGRAFSDWAPTGPIPAAALRLAEASRPVGAPPAPLRDSCPAWGKADGFRVAR